MRLDQDVGETRIWWLCVRSVKREIMFGDLDLCGQAELGLARTFLPPGQVLHSPQNKPIP